MLTNSFCTLYQYIILNQNDEERCIPAQHNWTTFHISLIFLGFAKYFVNAKTTGYLLDNDPGFELVIHNVDLFLSGSKMLFAYWCVDGCFI